MEKPRNRAAQDTTLINTRALKARVFTAEKQIDLLGKLIKHLAKRLSDLELLVKRGH